MSEKKEQDEIKTSRSKVSALLTMAAVAAVVIFIVRDPQRFLNILLVAMGFSVVVFVHELGHFVAAKSVGIMVEAFSIGFGPVLIGIQRVGGGIQVRLLPTLLPGKDGHGLLGFIIPTSSNRPGETEYRLSLFFFGGFVKMLGQEDSGTAEETEDPRAFTNKPVWQRAIVVSAGVTMNIICGVIVFMIVFSKGVDLPPAIVGDVANNSPAARAGLVGGDEIVAVNGKENIGFMELMLAGAFADEGEKVEFRVRRNNGTIQTLLITPEMNKALGLQWFGIVRPSTLTIARPGSDESLAALKDVGFEPGDQIVAVNGQDITRYDQLTEVLFPAAATVDYRDVSITVQRGEKDNTNSLTTITIPMELLPSGRSAGALLGMVPRLKITSVLNGSPAERAGLRRGDVVARLGSVSNPTMDEFGQYCRKHEDQSIEIAVDRVVDGESVLKVLSITPEVWNANWRQRLLGQSKPTIGVVIMPAGVDVPIVAHCKVFDDEREPLSLPRGAIVTAINAEPVANWQDMIDRFIEAGRGSAEITYRAGEDQPLQKISVELPGGTDWIGFGRLPVCAGGIVDLPLEPMKKLFKARSLSESLRMGGDQTYSFIAQTYLMISGMVKGTVSPKSASGPVGILKMSYTIVEQKSYIYYLYFMSIISVCIAVFNFLPLPILDGGLMVLLLVEKIKGSPVSAKIQGVINYIGLFLIGGLFLLVTCNDLIKVFTGQL